MLSFAAGFRRSADEGRSEHSEFSFPPLSHRQQQQPGSRQHPRVSIQYEHTANYEVGKGDDHGFLHEADDVLPPLHSGDAAGYEEDEEDGDDWDDVGATRYHEDGRSFKEVVYRDDDEPAHKASIRKGNQTL